MFSSWALGRHLYTHLFSASPDSSEIVVAQEWKGRASDPANDRV